MWMRAFAALLAASMAWPPGAGLRGQCTAANELHLRPTRYELDLQVDYQAEVIRGVVRLSLENQASEPTVTVPLLLYRLMSVTAARDDAGRALKVRQEVVSFEDWPKLQVTYAQVELTSPLASGAATTIEVHYSGLLLGYVETGMRYVQDRVDAEFTIIRPDAHAYPTLGYPCLSVNWAAGLPTFDYRATLTVPESLTVASGGELVRREVSSGRATYEYRSFTPVWRMDFAIADYGLLASGAHRVFYLPGDSAGGARVLAALEASLDLLANWFGPPAGARGLTVIEIPDGWGSQQEANTIIQAAAAFRDPERSGELYHEVSHLWNVPPLDVPSPRWNEGLASFLEEVATEKIEGRPVLAERVGDRVSWLREMLERRPELRTVPLIDYGRANMTDFSYSVGMIFFAVLYELVGHDAFGEIVGGFYERYLSSGATTDDFLTYALSVSEMDLDLLFKDWIYSTGWTGLVADHGSAVAIARRYRRD